MMIIQDENRLKEQEESRMSVETNSTGNQDDIHDLSISNGTKMIHSDLSKSANRRKQNKPNRVTNEEDRVLQQELNVDEANDLTNDQSSSIEDEISNSSPTSTHVSLPPQPPLIPSSPLPISQTQQSQQAEAYCNLCERSFCNKYFLKTHMAKKHNILNNVSPLSSTEQNDQISSMSLSPSADQQQQQLLQQPTVALPSILPIQSPTAAKPMDKFGEDYCEICQKRFCNKYYLRKHKGECHGIYTDYIKSLQKSSTESPMKNRRPSAAVTVPSNTLLLNPFYPGPSDLKSLYPITSTSSSPLITDSTSVPRKISPQRSSNRRCQLCEQEFRTKSLLRIHMTTVHGTENPPKLTLPASPLLSATNLGFLQPFLDTTSQLAQKVITGQTSQAPYGLVQDAYFCAKMADRVVCEICNKQVCNKYFLKTHKAKVHGITTNDPPEMSNENQTENSDTYCSICRKDFTTKYFYLFHMHTVHQDTSDPTYQTFLEFLKKASNLNESPSNLIEQFDAQTNLSSNRTIEDEDQQQQHDANDQDDETDSPSDRTSRKRSSSQSSNEQNSATKRFNSLVEMNNGGLQPFLLESEDPNFSETFVPCMVYLPVIRRVTKQVKINLRLKPVLTETAT